MIKIEFTEGDIQALNYERYHHPHPRVQRKMEALWLKSQGEPHNKIAQLTGISINVVTQYIKEYKAGGIEKLKELNFYRPATIKEAMSAIEKITGLKRSEKQVMKFLKEAVEGKRTVFFIDAAHFVLAPSPFSRGQVFRISLVFYPIISQSPFR